MMELTKNTKNEKVIDLKKTEEKEQEHRERVVKALLRHAEKLGW